MANAMKGIITLWSGAIVDIPYGWRLCDGTNGTPDLNNRFIIGAGTSKVPGATGGSNTHSHAFTSGTHFHSAIAGSGFEAGDAYAENTDAKTVSGTTGTSSNVPLYYALCYIMHI